MIRKEKSTQSGISAGQMLMGIALVVSALFLFGIGVIAFDQQQVLSNTNRIQEQTMPQMLNKQHLARNLERLHQEGENIFESVSAEGRQQALFMVKMIAAHPGIKEDARAEALALQSQKFLEQVVEQAKLDSAAVGKSREAWRQLSRQLGVLVDDMFSESVSLASGELGLVATAQRSVRYKLVIILPLLIGLLFMLLWQVQSLLVRPLQKMDDLLTQLDVLQTLPVQAASPLREITSLQTALRELHRLLKDKEKTRIALERLAGYDELTGLMNRRKFMESAEAELHRDHRHRRPVVVAMADIDLFKSINDTYGHPVGDQVLKALAAILRNDLRETDLVGRVGGEEFAFVLPETTPVSAEHLMERVRVAFQECDIRSPDGQRIQTSISIGIADASILSLDVALQHADAALYAAKSKGRNRVETHAVLG